MSDIQIFINGKIFTSDGRRPWADAMIAEDGKIVWIGSGKELPDRKGQVTDLKGRRVIPGFVDAHMHPVMLADFQKKIAVMPPGIRSLKDLEEAVRDCRGKQGPGQWIRGWGYDEQALDEKRSPNRWDLDRGCSDAPVSIMRTCAHICCVNSMALKLAGIDRNTPDPPGGKIERDAFGEPTGVLKENARNLLAPYLPAEPREKQVENLLELGELLASQGVTAVCDMGNLDSSDNFPIYEEAARRGFRQRVGVYYMWDFFGDHPEEFHLLEGRGDRRKQIFAAGLKLIGDGSVSGRTAWMAEPYEGSKDDFGLPVCSEELLESAIRFCREQGCQLSMHAMGTRAIDRMVRRGRRGSFLDGRGDSLCAGGACDPALGREHAAGRGAWDRLCHPAYFPLRGNRQLPGESGAGTAETVLSGEDDSGPGRDSGILHRRPGDLLGSALGSFPGTEAGRYQAGGGGDRLRSRSGGDGGDSHTAVYQRGGPGCRDERLRNAGGGIPGGFRGAQRRYF